jgi:hypothetical protein
MAILLNDNLQINAGKPVDAKYLASTNQPYASVAAANSAIPQSYRYIGLKVNVNNVEYWYYTGVTDSDLVALETPESASGITVATNGLTKLGDGKTVVLGGDLTGATTININSQSLTIQTNPMQYAADYSGQYDEFSIPDAGYVTGLTDGLQSQITTNAGNIADNAADIVYLSGQTDAAFADLAFVSGQTDTNTTNISNNADDITFLGVFSGDTVADLSFISGATDTNTSNIADNTADITYLSGQTDLKLATADFNVYSAATSADISYISGETAANDADIAFISANTVNTANNGLEKIGTNVRLGGALTGDTAIDLAGNTLEFTTNLLEYTADYSGQISARTIPDAAWVTGQTGAIDAQNGLTRIGSNIELGGDLTGNTCVNTATFGLALGAGSVATGQDAVAVAGGGAYGDNTWATAGGKAYGANSWAISNGIASGTSSGALASGCALGTGSLAIGFGTIASGSSTFVLGGASVANGFGSQAFGYCVTTNATGAFALGNRVKSCGAYSFAFGKGVDTKEVLTSGTSAINFSTNTTAQSVGFGADANNSTILGGINHHIEAGNVGATIVGRCGTTGVQLTDTSYIDNVVVPNLAIWSTPASSSCPAILVHDDSDMKVKQSTIADLGAVTGATNGLQVLTNDIGLGGTLSETNTNILGATNNLSIGTSGSRIGTLNQFATNTLIDSQTLTCIRTTGTGGDLVIDAQNQSEVVIKSQNGAVAGDTFSSAVGFNLDYFGNIFSIIDNRAGANQTGIVYQSDYSDNYVDRSLVDKAYVDAVAAGLDAKDAANLATTVSDGNIDLTGGTFVSGSTIDGVVVQDGWRVLIKNQTDNVENGIYVYSASTSGFTRSEDFDGTPAGEVSNGAFLSVITGDTLINTQWIVTTPDPITVDVTGIDFSLLSQQLDVVGSSGITVTTQGAQRAIAVDVDPNCALGFDGLLQLQVKSEIAGLGSTYQVQSGYSEINLNIENSGATGTEINVQIDTGGTNVLMIDSDDVAAALGTPITSANNGLTKSGSNIRLGGTLTGNTSIDGTASYYDFTLDCLGAFTLDLNGTPSIITDNNSNGGLRYATDYSGDFVCHSLVDYNFVTGCTSNLQSQITTNAGNISDNAADISYISGVTDANLIAVNADLAYISGVTDTNTTNISTNAGNISDNTDDITFLGTLSGLTQTAIQTANNGLTKNGTNVRLGGTLTGSTIIDTANAYGLVIGQNGVASTNSLAVGYTDVSGCVLATNESIAFGCAFSPYGKITADNRSFAFGSSLGNYTDGHIGAIGYSNLAFGSANGANICTSTNTRGSIAGGYAYSYSLFAPPSTASTITVNTFACGSIAFGVAKSGSICAYGTGSIAMGFACAANYSTQHGRIIAKGNGSVALGFGCNDAYTCAENTAFAFGLNACARNCSIAMGEKIHATGNNSFAVGYYSCATGTNSIAIGRSCATGGRSTAIGHENCATGQTSMIFGKSSVVGGSYSAALGTRFGCNFGNYSVMVGGCNSRVNSGANCVVTLGLRGETVTATTWNGYVIANQLSIWNTPDAGAGTDSLLVWDSADRKVKTVSQGAVGITSAANGLSVGTSGDVFVLGGTLTGDTVVDTNNFGIVFGENTSVVSGKSAIAFGTYNTANGNYSIVGGACSIAGENAFGGSSIAVGRYACAFAYGSQAFGVCAKATGDYSHAHGCQTLAYGTASHAEGAFTCAYGAGSHAEGGVTNAYGAYSHAEGKTTRANSCASHTGGLGTTVGGSKEVYAFGLAAFNHSTNTSSQTAGHGALADGSVILGGLNHNIESGNVRAAIIGGNTIKLTGSSYIDHVAVANLAIFSTPTNGDSSDEVIVWDSVDKKLKKVTQSSIADQAVTGADNGLSIGTGGEVILGGSLTGATNININSQSLSFESNPIEYVGDYSGQYDARSIPDAGYVTGITSGLQTQITNNDNDISFISGVTDTNTSNISDNTDDITFLGTFSANTVADLSFISGATDTNTSNIADNTADIAALGAISGLTQSAVQTANNGITKTGTNVYLGGDLTGNTTIGLAGNGLVIGSGSSIANYITFNNIAIEDAPEAGSATGDAILVWNSTDKKVKQVDATSLGEDNNVYAITAISSNQTLTTSEYVVVVDTSGGPVTVTLPSSPVTGQAYKIKDSGNALTNAVTIGGNANNIDGAATASINTDYGALEVVYDGTEWWTLAFIN